MTFSVTFSNELTRFACHENLTVFGYPSVMQKAAGAFLCLVLGTAFVAVQAQENEQLLGQDPLYQEARNFYKIQNYSAALLDLIPFIRQNPRFEEGYVLLGNILLCQGDLNRSQESFNKARMLESGEKPANQSLEEMRPLNTKDAVGDLPEEEKSSPSILEKIKNYLGLEEKKDFLYSGTIEAVEVRVAPRIMARVAEIFPREGAVVEKGQLVATLSCGDIQTEFDLAQKNYNRGQLLFEQGSATQEELDALKARYQEAEIHLNWCKISSPISGTVLYRPVEPGDMAGPQTVILSLADLRSVYAYVYVPQPMLARLSIGEEASGYLPEMNMRAFSGHIEFIRPEAEFTPKNVQTQKERTRLVYGIKVAFDNPDKILKPGMPIEVRLGP